MGGAGGGGEGKGGGGLSEGGKRDVRAACHLIIDAGQVGMHVYQRAPASKRAFFLGTPCLHSCFLWFSASS